MSSEKEAASELPQLDVRFLGDRNSWNVNRTPRLKNCEGNAQEY